MTSTKNVSQPDGFLLASGRFDEPNERERAAGFRSVIYHDALVSGLIGAEKGLSIYRRELPPLAAEAL